MLNIPNLRLRNGAPPCEFSLGRGETCVLLGRNNSGKTNLLRLVAGLRGQASGDVDIDSGSVEPGSRPQSPAAFVFQAFVNYPHWTVRQNLESPLRAVRMKARDREERVQRVANSLQITELLERLPAQLSGGQQQRVALGRALCKQAPIVLLDEPFVNLDFRLRERLTNELASLLRETNTSALFATSDSRDAFALGNRVALLADHQLIQTGQPIDVYTQPDSLLAADLMSEPGVNYTPMANGVCAVRPEHLSLAERAGSHKFVLQVGAVETNGSHSFVQGRLCMHADAAGNTHAVRELPPTKHSPPWVAKLIGVPEVALGATLSLYVHPDNLLNFAGTSFQQVGRGIG